jgi:hypothetical protein
VGFAVYYFVAMVVAIYIRKWASVPFLWLFFSGFAYMGFMSLADVQVFRRFFTEELEDEESSHDLVQ